MAAFNIVPAQLAGNIGSEDVKAAPANGNAMGSGDTFTIQAGGNDNLILVVYSAAGATLTVTKGENPPSLAANLGGGNIGVGAGEVKLWVPRAARHLLANGTMIGQASGSLVLSVYRLPAGFSGFNGLLREAGVA